MTHCCPAPSSGLAHSRCPIASERTQVKCYCQLSSLLPALLESSGGKKEIGCHQTWVLEYKVTSLPLAGYSTRSRPGIWAVGRDFPPSIQAHTATFFPSFLASAWGREPSGELIDQKPKTLCCHLNYIWFILQTSYKAGESAFKQTHIRITPPPKNK